MKFGMFMQPSHPPDRAVYDGIQQDLGIIEELDRLGYSEVWVGEHLSAPWEPYPACDLILAQAIERTSQIKLCSGAYVATFYHPAALAHRIMQLDHQCQGRFMAGIAAGGIPTDYTLVGVDGASGANRDMMREAIDIMMKIWTQGQEPWEYKGKFWSVTNPEPMGAYRPHMRPYQSPHPPIGIASLSPQSSSIRYAGEHSFIPLSLTFNVEYLKDHWIQFEEGAATTGKPAHRKDWRLIREMYVADTDKEAKDWVRNSHMAGHWNEQNFPFLRSFNFLKYCKEDDTPTDTVDIDYLIEHLWLVGSPDTVTQKLADIYERTGGFGTIVMQKYDYGDDKDAYFHSLDLLATEVVPAFERMGLES